jgi:metal-sulfur cluster biosynthetic enzyme
MQYHRPIRSRRGPAASPPILPPPLLTAPAPTAPPRPAGARLVLSGPPEALLRALAALRQVRDAETGADIVELGLVESLELSGGEARLQLVTPGPDCPLGDFNADVALRALQVALPDTDLYVSHDPWVEWDPGRASVALRNRYGWRVS